MKTQIANVLNQEMDRKEFLRFIGVGILMLVGGGAIMQAIGALQPKSAKSSSSFGYGGRSYGGR